jgi:hypothetical protein
MCSVGRVQKADIEEALEKASVSRGIFKEVRQL